MRLNLTGDVRGQLERACNDRRIVVAGDASGRFTVAAEDLRAVALRVSEPFGLRLIDAHITGELDLRAATVPVPLHLLGCVFDHAPRFDGADLHELVIAATEVPATGLGATRASWLPGLLANGLRIRRDLVLSASTIRGAHRTSASLSKSSAVWLTEASIGGRLLAVGTVIEATGDRALQCDRTEIAGDVRLVRGFHANGEIRLLAVRLGGSLDLRAARLLPGNARALDLSESTVGGSIFIIDDPGFGLRPEVRGRIEMGRVTVNGRILVRNADIHAPSPGDGRHDYNATEHDSRVAVLAPRLVVDGEVIVEPDTVINGGLLLPGAELRGGISLEHARLWNPGETSLDLSQARIGSGLRLAGALVEGTVSLAGAHIAGPLDLSAARLTQPSATGRCLDGVGASVDGDVGLRGLTAQEGSINLRGARLGGVVEAEGATLDNPGGRTLSLHQARVAGNVRLCAGFRSNGLVMLTRAVVEGRLRCDDAVFAWDRPPAAFNSRAAAVEAISATFRNGMSLGWTITAGSVVVTDAQTSFLADRPDSDWPGETFMSGFEYARYKAPDNTGEPAVWDARTRIRWLSRLGPFDPGSWERAARVLRDNGDRIGAEQILIARGRHARRHGIGFAGRPLRRFADLALDILTGYGQRPWRALIVLAALIAVVTLALALPAGRAQMRPTGSAQSVPCASANVRCINPLFYAVDTVVPVIDLKQRSTWYPDTSHGGLWLEVLLDLCTILGWAASSVFLLSFARLGRGGP
ncbi:hypothetical protein ACQP00_17580 [Dactylosporangium sp. CS-047395]|uniref:hypothetical protein n=1 Tax=Dactylosporangium sp. CS-047395 TaxID=3239936 RepID=UPI003D8A5E8D